MNLEKIAKDHWNRHIQAIMTDGETLVGKVVGYASAEDNEPNPEGIIIECTNGALVEIFRNEIERIAGEES